jgi:hypothetical protein
VDAAAIAAVEVAAAVVVAAETAAHDPHAATRHFSVTLSSKNLLNTQDDLSGRPSFYSPAPSSPFHARVQLFHERLSFSG